MRAILSIVIFILSFTSLGSPFIIGAFLVLGFISHERDIGYLDLEWYYHLGFILYSILVLKLLVKGSRILSDFILRVFK
ncbi:hypothetical protein [Sphingobacterium sp. MYb388]|uniref:hypothetical protein n=1 Tax=Sphingobacterium sp. MYb388 TaxID=2745437 RepID=UPI003095B70D